MKINVQQQKGLIDKIGKLTPDRITQVEDFIDFLRQRDQDRRLTQASAKLSEKAFHEVWDNTSDADYDRL